MLHCMIDLETLGVDVNSAILTIGAVLFDPFKTNIADYCVNGTNDNPDFDVFYCRVDLDSCLELGMTTDEDTEKWWANQSKEAVEEAFSTDDRISVKDAIRDLTKFSRKAKKYWAKSPQFDCSILESAAKKVGLGVPWQYYDLLDVRSYVNAVDFEESKAVAHHALADAIAQAANIQIITAKLVAAGVKKLPDENHK